jgi:hypothetical protein
VGQVGNLRRIDNPPGVDFGIILRADCQSAAGYQPAPLLAIALYPNWNTTQLLGWSKKRFS